MDDTTTTNKALIMGLQKDMDEVRLDVKKILENHLPHINVKIAVLMAQMVILMAAVSYLIFK